jgi:bla regulator protein blaR1
MNAISVTSSVITHSLAWALVHSLWQGTIVYGVLYLILRFFPDINARIKYYLSFGALTALALWFADTWITEYQKLKVFIVYVSGTNTEHAITHTYSVKQ